MYMTRISIKSHENQDYVLLPFTSGLQAFHRYLSEFAWRKKIPECVFIRDFENLPTKASYDIDLMASEKMWPALTDVFKSTAKKCELICLYRTSHAGLYILIFDVNQEEGRRSWSYYEIRKELPFVKNKTLTSNDIEISNEKGLPIPSKSWQFILFLHQGLRKNKIIKYKMYLNEMLTADPDIHDLCCERLGLSTDDIRSIINSGDDLGKWRDKTNIHYAVGKTTPVISRISELKKKIARKYYIWHIKGPMLFTIHGPDGVGKTTVTQEISKILSEYPFAHDVFHHISGWKKKPVLTENIDSHNKSDSRDLAVPLWRKILRVIYRNSPEFIQAIWLYSSNYIKYSSNLNRHILKRFYGHKIVVCDRYIYDLWAKEQVAPAYSKILFPLHYLFNRALRFPIRTFLINDDPTEIYKRKQELSVDQISQYQDSMDNIVQSLNVPTLKILVSGRKPRDIAREMVTVILKDIDPEVFNLMREEAVKKSNLENILE